MKFKILTVVAATLLLVSCNQKNNVVSTTDENPMGNDTAVVITDSTMMDNDSTMLHDDDKMRAENAVAYSCPMHPEIKGAFNDKCSKCGMKLSVKEVESKEND